MKLRIEEDIKGKLRNPVMLAGWPGMGNVGATAVRYMRWNLGAKEFAHIDMYDELLPQSVHVREGLVLLPELPMTRFYYVEDPAMIFVESQSQVAGPAATVMMRGVLDFARDLQVSTIYTAASFAMPMSCRQEIKIYGAANDVVLRDQIAPMGATLLEEGEISGLNGVLLGFTNGYEIPAACLMATMPQYAVRLPNPKSSRALIGLFERTLGFHVNMTELDDEIRKMEEAMLEIEKRIQEVASTMPDEISRLPRQEVSVQEKHEKRTPERAMQKIEQLFEELAAERSKGKATRLKEELDRWDLYDLYEDRFLDLFRGDKD